jgi:hypothetical protein
MKKTMLFSLAALCISAAVNAQTDTTGKGKSDTTGTATDSTKKALNLGKPHAAANAAKVQKVTAASFTGAFTMHAEAVLNRRNPATFAKSAMKA